MRIYQFKYVERFKCDGSICHAQCCQKWHIPIDKGTYKRYHWIKNTVVKNKILGSIIKTKGGKEYCIQMDENGKCPLICKDDMCYIQRNLGAEALSEVCKTYPRKAVVLGNCQLRSLSMTCPVAAEEALFSSDGMVLEKIDNQNEKDSNFNLVLRNLNKKRLPDTKAIDSIIIGGLLILQNRNFSREERMVLLGLFLDRVDDIELGDETADEIINIALAYQTEKFQDEAREIMSAFSFNVEKYQQIMTKLLSEAAEQEQLGALEELKKQVDNYTAMHDKWHQSLEDQYGRAIDNFWLQEFLHHGYPFRFEGSFMHNYLAYILSYKMWEIILYGYIAQVDHILKKDGFMLAINTYSKIMDHKRKYLPIIDAKAADLEKEPLKAMQMLLKLK